MSTPLHDYPYVNCRAFGHVWRLMTIRKHETYKHAETITLGCIGDCKRHRVDTVSFSGALLERDYLDVPKDYALDSTHTRDEFRAEVLRRACKSGAKLTVVS